MISSTLAAKMRILTIIILISLSSCATILHNSKPLTDYQKIKPEKGDKMREVRSAEFIINLFLCFPCIGVDLITHQIYKPKCASCKEETQ